MNEGQNLVLLGLQGLLDAMLGHSSTNLSSDLVNLSTIFVKT